MSKNKRDWSAVTGGLASAGIIGMFFSGLKDINDMFSGSGNKSTAEEDELYSHLSAEEKQERVDLNRKYGV